MTFWNVNVDTYINNSNDDANEIFILLIFWSKNDSLKIINLI
jgi:hypothetical protein